ncbi:MAG: hypothetical protein SX243_21920 [Acidobacteriota bacterium]|nr:hypothetical protein [Acidobacteriota bacterium]
MKDQESSEKSGPTAPDETAQEWAHRVLEALGGAQAWSDTRALSFSFAGFRSHWWDRQTGAHRYEGTTREEGQHYVVLHNLHDRKGKVFLDGELISGRDAEEWLDQAYSAWINDTYWLLMPYKLQDPGVHLTYEGVQDFQGKPHETLLMSFEGVGLTPGDRYWVYVDPQTHLVAGWSYILESYEADRPATAWAWGDWQRYGEILLASERSQVGGDRQLPMQDIAVYDQLPASIFEDPSPQLGAGEGQ